MNIYIYIPLEDIVECALGCECVKVVVGLEVVVGCWQWVGLLTNPGACSNNCLHLKMLSVWKVVVMEVVEHLVVGCCFIYQFRGSFPQDERTKERLAGWFCWQKNRENAGILVTPDLSGIEQGLLLGPLA